MIVRESINFERGLDPKQSMGIGIEGQIKKYLEENDFDYGDPGSLQQILDDSKISRETREEWAKYILSKGYDWDENELFEMFQQQIPVVQWLPLGKKEIDEIELIKGAEGWDIIYPDWTAFTNYFKGTDFTNYIKAVLSGDSWDFFEDTGEYLEISDIQNFIESNDIALADFRKAFIDEGGEDYVNKDFSDTEMFDTIEEGEFGNLETVLKRAGGETSASANEDEAYKDLKKSIIDHYGLSNTDWDTDKEEFSGDITEEGVERLFQTVYLEEEEIPFNNTKHDNLMGDWNAETFSGALENQLENL